MEPKRNILLLNSTLHIGGAENVIATLCRSLDRSRFNVTVCYLKECGSVGDKLLAEGYEVVGVKEPGQKSVDYLSSLKLKELIQERQIDLVHSHDLHSLIDGAICRMLDRRVRHIHTFHFGNYPHRPRRYLILERIFCRIPDRLIAVGNIQNRSLVTTFKVGEQRLRTIWNGVAIEQRQLPAAAQRVGDDHDRKIVIGSISTLIEQKGITYLLDVAARLKQRHDNFVVVIAGEGHLRPELQRKCDALGLSGVVQFLGWVNEAASTVLPEIDIFFQPSLWEAMSMVLLEAMAQGKPVVATSVGENPFIIDDGVTGYLTEPRDVAGMTEALERLIRDAGLRARLGAAGRAKWQRYFDAGVMAGRYADLYAEVLAGQVDASAGN